MLAATAIFENFLRKLLQQQKYGKSIYGGWCPISAIAVGCLFIMHEADAKTIDCQTVTILEMRIANTPLSFIDLGNLESGILVTSDVDATATAEPKKDELIHDLRSDFINISQPLLKAFAYGPEIAAEDELMSAEAQCTSRGIAIDMVVRLAVPPNTGSRRRIVWRPILSILMKAKTSFRLDINWIKRSSDRIADVVIASRKEIIYSQVNK